MEMSSHLESLLVELTEHIVTFLPFNDVSSLRLTSHAMEERVSQGSFASFFKCKDIKLTTTTMTVAATLQDMERLTSQSRLVRLLEHCTITGIVHSDTTATASDEAADEDLRTLLSQAFYNLALRSPNSKLVSLRLRVVADGEKQDEPDVFRDWKSVWNAAQRTFQITMAALQESQLLVADLDIFSSIKGCSLASDVFLAFTKQSISRPVLGSLEKLAISLSVPPAAATDPDSGDLLGGTEAHAQSRYSQLLLPDLQDALCHMPQLENLDVHWYNLNERAPFAPPLMRNPELGKSISPTLTASAPQLKECRLRGLHVSESFLLRFLAAGRPLSLTVTDTRLVSGTYAPIFDFLTGTESPVTCFALEDNCEQNTKLVHFEVPGKPKFRYRGGNVGPSVIVRRGGHAREDLRYRLPPGRVIGAGERNRWIKAKAEEFGPLDGHYDFVGLNRVDVLVGDDEDGQDKD